MTDIVERLRKDNSMPPYYGPPAIQIEAADEIERLRAALLGEETQHSRCIMGMDNARRVVPEHFMLDPPDGGDVSLAEGIERLMAEYKRLHAALEDIILYSDDYHKAVPIARDALMVNRAALETREAGVSSEGK